LDLEKISSFVYMAHHKRAFPFMPNANPVEVLTHLNLMQEGKITNAAILLFGKNPQKFFITSEVKCALFFGTDVEKPIPSYQIYKGDVFQLITQAKNFVVSNIKAKTGARDKNVQVEIEYELPLAALTEAIVNAICHRDYTNNGSVQVMLFRDRLEVWNPGHLPYGMTIAKLKQFHNSMPVNPLLAEAMFLNGTIEKAGTGTRDMLRLCKAAGLQEPEFIQEEMFRTILWRDLLVNSVAEGPDKLQDKLQDKLTPVQQMIIAEITKNISISVSGLSEIINLSERAIYYNLSVLKEKGFIERIGAKRNGYWKIKSNS
jgi:predicted HTH transcriptional regulator